MNKSDTIDTRGYLSAEIQRYREDYRKQYASAFATCEEKSDAATARLFGTDLGYIRDSEAIHILLGIGFWCRSVSACQAALRLLECGMVPEGQILIRSAYEFLFFGAASAKDSSVFDQIAVADAQQRIKQARGMIKSSSITPKEIELLNEVIELNQTQGQGLSAYDAAAKAGLVELYDTVYRGMSLIASHGTITATDYVFEDRGEGQFGVVFGPNDKHLEFSVNLLGICLAEGIKLFDKFLPLSSDVAHAAADQPSK
jgi:hypothetical protein